MSNTLLNRLLIICVMQFAASFSVAGTDEAYLLDLPDPYSDSGWTKEIDRRGMQIYTRDWPGSDFVAVKAVQSIDASVSSIVANYADVESFPEWVEDMKEARELSAFDSEHTRHVYMRMNMPWPLKDRDIVAKQHYSQDERNQIVTIREIHDNEKLKELDGVVRVPKTNMELLLVPVDETKTTFIFQGHNDPGGFIPSFIVNWMIEEVFYKSMLNMKERFEAGTDAERLDWVKDQALK